MVICKKAKEKGINKKRNPSKLAAAESKIIQKGEKIIENLHLKSSNKEKKSKKELKTTYRENNAKKKLK